MPSYAISHVSLKTPDWMSIRLQTPETAAASLKSILSAYDPIEKQVFAIRGMAMLLVEERELYRFVIDEEVGDYYQSFDRFIKQTLPNSWGYCRDALRTIKELKDTPFEDLLQIKRCNLEQLKKVSSGVRALPEVVKAAKSMPEKAFVEKMNVEHHQALETNKPVVMAPAGDVDEFEHAIEIATLLEDCHTRAEAIKAIAIDYTQEHETEYLAKTEGVA